MKYELDTLHKVGTRHIICYIIKRSDTNLNIIFSTGELIGINEIKVIGIFKSNMEDEFIEQLNNIIDINLFNDLKPI